MKICYETEMVFGEPPPSVIVFGSPAEMERLSKRLLNGVDEVDLGADFHAVFSGEIESFVIRCSRDEHLVRMKGKSASIALDGQRRTDLALMLGELENDDQFLHADFDGADLVEEANLIFGIPGRLTRA